MVSQKDLCRTFEDFLDYENIVYMHDKNRQLRIGIMCSFEDKGRPFETIVSEHQFELYFVIDDAVFREELTQEDQMLLKLIEFRFRLRFIVAMKTLR